MSFDQVYTIVMIGIAHVTKDPELARRAIRVVPHHRRAFLQWHRARLKGEQRSIVDQYFGLKFDGVI
jgi:hypothetical protein